MDNKSYEEQIKALTKISRAITSEHYLEDILSLIVMVTAKVMGSNICSIMLVDEKKKEIVIKATQSISEEYNKKLPLKKGEGITGKVIKNKKPIAVKDILKSKEYKYKEIARKEGLKSLLCVPLNVRGKAIGVINCYTSIPHVFTAIEVNVLTTIANQAAVAIENTELMVKTRVIQEELESRKKVERAKGLLMKERGMTEDEAYGRIQKYSMDNRKSMREVAEAIILSFDMRNKK